MKNWKKVFAFILSVACAIPCISIPASADTDTVGSADYSNAAVLSKIPEEYFEASDVFSGATYCCDENGNVISVRNGKLFNVSSDAIIAEGFENVSNLYYVSGFVYFVQDGFIRKINIDTLEIADIAAALPAELFVGGDGTVYTLENGDILVDGIISVDVRIDGNDDVITRFCPVPGGYVFSTGNFLNYRLFAIDASGEITVLADSVESWTVENKAVTVDTSSGEKMLMLDSLFSGKDFDDFNLYGTGDVDALLDSVSGTINVDGKVLTAEEVKAAEVSQLPVSYRKTVSNGAQNVIKRARQMYEIEWTALADVQGDTGIGQSVLFHKGCTYKGVPYGQPVHKGMYITSLDRLKQFYDAANNVSSKLYTDKGENTYNYTVTNGKEPIRYCPYYSSDCSAFVSYAWGLSRTTTSDVASMAKKGTSGYHNMGKNLTALETGYALCTDSSGHIILIYDVEYDSNGNLLRVTTLEQVEPMIRKKVYGVGGNAGAISDLKAYINNSKKPYSIIKQDCIDSVKFEASSISPIDNETNINFIKMPGVSHAEDKPASGSFFVSENESTFEISGYSFHTSGIQSYSYQLDGGEWKALTSKYSSQIMGSEYLRFAANTDVNCFIGNVPTPSSGSHTVAVRAALKNGSTYNVANFTVKVAAPSEMKITFQMNYDEFSINGVKKGVAGTTAKELYYSGLTAGNLLIENSGWVVASVFISDIEYRVDDGPWLSGVKAYRDDVYKALGDGMPKKNRTVNAFIGGCELSYLSNDANHTYKMRLVGSEGQVLQFLTVYLGIGNAPAIETPAPTTRAPKTPKPGSNQTAAETAANTAGQSTQGNQPVPSGSSQMPANTNQSGGTSNPAEQTSENKEDVNGGKNTGDGDDHSGDEEYGEDEDYEDDEGDTKKKTNPALIIILSVGGALIIAAAVVVTVLLVGKKKEEDVQ